MFSSTAYEAFYSYIGLYLHEASIAIITSEAVLKGLLLLILGVSFLLGVWRYFSRYMPGMFGSGRSVKASFFFKIIACFLLGMALLKVDVQEDVKNYKRDSWKNNPYINSRSASLGQPYRVSFVFALLTTAAEEIAGFASSVIDRLFLKTNSELQAPGAFYKAVLYAGSQTIDDPGLRDKIDVYANSCFDKILPLLGQAKHEDRFDEFFRKNGVVDHELRHIPIEIEGGGQMNCMALKDEVRDGLAAFAATKGAQFSQQYHGRISLKPFEITDKVERNLIASHALVNHFLAKTEDNLGTQDGAKVQGVLAKFLVGWSRFWSFDGFLNLIGQGDQVGAALTAERAEKFSEHLQRAPHLKGMVKMFLIALFPWMVFFVIAGRWKVLVAWFTVYASVLLWTPIWTGLYHIMTSIALSTEVMHEFGKVSDGISLYSSSFITAKLYQFYAIYAWLQLILGPLPTVILGYGMLSSVVKDSEGENAPAVVTAAKDVGMGAATGGASGAAQAAVRRV